eukprot:m.345173 g.345173  ORF g.345173 m.345173 type:complete len:375 (+) comp25851_c0_seq1:92-1216(+)
MHSILYTLSYSRIACRSFSSQKHLHKRMSSTTDAQKRTANTAVEESQENLAKRRAAGEFVRGVSTARTVLKTAQSGRYHLYVAYNCPWCHRTALARSLLGLEDVVSMDVLMPVRTEADHPVGEGLWQFKPEGLTARNGKHVQYEECTKDTVCGKGTIVEIYKMFGMEQKSVPILFDKQTMTIVNNESSEIIRMFETVFLPLGKYPKMELYPSNLAEKIDEYNSFIYTDINNGAYKAGFSSKQDVYELAYDKYFAAWDRIEEILKNNKFLCGEEPTEADLRLFPTIFRHDPVYHNRMKLNKAFVSDYPCLWRWLCDFYALPGVEEASPLNHMKQGYFGRTGNSTVPVGPPGYPELLHDRDYARKRKEALSKAGLA